MRGMREIRTSLMQIIDESSKDTVSNVFESISQGQAESPGNDSRIKHNMNTVNISVNELSNVSYNRLRTELCLNNKNSQNLPFITIDSLNYSHSFIHTNLETHCLNSSQLSNSYNTFFQIQKSSLQHSIGKNDSLSTNSHSPSAYKLTLSERQKKIESI